MLCVLIRIASMNRLNIQSLCRKSKRLTLSGSNYPCLERISMVPKMFESLRFDCNMQCNTALSLGHVFNTVVQTRLRRCSDSFSP